MSYNIKTYMILFGGVFALSTSAIFVKIAEAPSPVIAFYRLLIAGLVLLPVFLLSKNSRSEIKTINGKQWGQIVSAGLFLALHYVLWFESLKHTSVASSTTIVCTEVIWECLGFCLFLKGKLSRKAVKICFSHNF